MEKQRPPEGSLPSWLEIEASVWPGPPALGSPGRAGSLEEGEQPETGFWGAEVNGLGLLAPRSPYPVSGLAPDPTRPAPSPQEPKCPRTTSSVETGKHMTGRESSSCCPLSRIAPTLDQLQQQ